MACAPFKDSDQPAHLCSLIRVFDWCSMGSQGTNISSAGTLKLIRLFDVHPDMNLRCKNMSTHTLCWIPAHLYIQTHNMEYRGSYMSAHVLMNLLNELRKIFYLFFATSSINSIIQEHGC